MAHAKTINDELIQIQHDGIETNIFSNDMQEQQIQSARLKSTDPYVPECIQNNSSQNHQNKSVDEEAYDRISSNINCEKNVGTLNSQVKSGQYIENPEEGSRYKIIQSNNSHYNEKQQKFDATKTQETFQKMYCTCDHSEINKRNMEDMTLLIQNEIKKLNQNDHSVNNKYQPTNSQNLPNTLSSEMPIENSWYESLPHNNQKQFSEQQYAKPIEESQQKKCLHDQKLKKQENSMNNHFACERSIKQNKNLEEEEEYGAEIQNYSQAKSSQMPIESSWYENLPHNKEKSQTIRKKLIQNDFEEDESRYIRIDNIKNDTFTRNFCQKHLQNPQMPERSQYELPRQNQEVNKRNNQVPGHYIVRPEYNKQSLFQHQLNNYSTNDTQFAQNIFNKNAKLTKLIQRTHQGERVIFCMMNPKNDTSEIEIGQVLHVIHIEEEGNNEPVNILEGTKIDSNKISNQERNEKSEPLIQKLNLNQHQGRQNQEGQQNNQNINNNIKNQNARQRNLERESDEEQSSGYDATLYNFFDGTKYPRKFGDGGDHIKYTFPQNVIKELPVPVDNLIKMMFDENLMEKILTKNTVHPEILKTKPFPSKTQILDSLDSLKQYHKSGVFNSKIRFLNKPKLSSEKDISFFNKILNDMLLMYDTYMIIKEFRQDSNYVYRYYEKLNTKIRLLEKNCEEYKKILKYVENSHGPTHTNYTLEVKEIFKISRFGEFSSYKKVKDKYKFSKLLWFGTRATNYPSILSKGLQLPPPQSNNPGLYFGNGIYFTDVVSKAANKCEADKNNRNGLLLLAEVCLGDTIKKTKPENINCLNNKSGCVKGLGNYSPNRKDHFHTNLGVQVPLGTLVFDQKLQSRLNYNEYVVYNSNQILLQYLVQVKFHFK